MGVNRARVRAQATKADRSAFYATAADSSSFCSKPNSGAPGRHDLVHFGSGTDPQVSKALEWLGGRPSATAHDLLLKPPSDSSDGGIDHVKYTGPVWMTTAEVHRVHEPEPVDSRAEVSVDLDSILRPEVSTAHSL